MRTTQKRLWPFLVLLSCVGFVACTSHYFRANYDSANQLLHETENLQERPFLKAHMRNGDVYIFGEEWLVDTITNELVAYGAHYDFNRNKKAEQICKLPLDEVAIFETNMKIDTHKNGKIAALSILAALDVGLGIVCLTTPKACFGSCPTFYMDPTQDFHYSDAEGFSNAIAPCLEYTDIDALNNPSVDGLFSITMKNEAQETHCVNDLQLLAYPRSAGQRVFHSRSDKFYLCEGSVPPTLAVGSEGECTALVSNRDGIERFRLANETDLATREEVILEFENPVGADQLGLVVSFRQTMMTTYFIYSAIGYMGNEVGDIFASLETSDNPKGQFGGGLYEELGDLEVEVWHEASQAWIEQGGWYETGPIAVNEQIIPLNYHAGSALRVRLTMTEGLWRIDHAALTQIIEEVEPVSLSPISISLGGQDYSKGKKLLSNPEDYIISMPGDEFLFDFEMPQAGQDYELFLSSTGYYLEWMRSEWIKDKDLWELRSMLKNPAQYLRDQASYYKTYESQIEADFWNSRIDPNQFSYHEN
jgi:hypothetical protein